MAGIVGLGVARVAGVAGVAGVARMLPVRVAIGWPNWRLDFA